jgi:hypothetical protein
MFVVTRKVVDIENLRAEVQRHAPLDAWMSYLILLADPFQRATDREGAKPCFQRVYTPLRCSAEIPLDPQNAILCNDLADVIFEEGPRCSSCAAEFGGTPLTEDIESFTEPHPTPFVGTAAIVALKNLTA